MAVAVFPDTHCKSCGKFHTLYNPDARTQNGLALYTYVCPATGDEVTIRLDIAHNPQTYPPAGGLEIKLKKSV